MSTWAEIETVYTHEPKPNPNRKPNTKVSEKQIDPLERSRKTHTIQQYQFKCKFPGGFTWRNVLWKGKRHDKGKMRDQILPWGHIFH